MSMVVSPSPTARVAVVSLVVAAVGVVVQIVGGVDFPPVPPVFFILLVPAAVLVLTSSWWAPLPAVLAALFLTVGLVLSGEAARLFNTGLQGGPLGSAGLWIQTAAVAVAGVAAARATVEHRRGGAGRPTRQRGTR